MLYTASQLFKLEWVKTIKLMCSTHESALHFGRDIVWQRHFQELGNHAPASFTWEELAQISNELRVCIEGSAPSIGVPENTLTMYVHQNVHIYQQYIHKQKTQMEICQQLSHEHTLWNSVRERFHSPNVSGIKSTHYEYIAYVYTRVYGSFYSWQT